MGTLLLQILLLFLTYAMVTSLDLHCHPVMTAVLPGYYGQTGEVVAGGNVYQPGQYEPYNNRSDLFRVCICEVRTCLRKCCNANQIFVNKKCQNHTSIFQPTVYYQISDNQFLPLPDYDLSQFYKVYGDSCTNGKYMLAPEDNPDDEFHLVTSGNLAVGKTQIGFQTADYFCMDQMDSEYSELKVLVCFPPENTIPGGNFVYKVYPIGLIISMPFLLVTLIVYAVLPDLRNLHGLSLMCHVSSLLVAYIVLAIIQLGGDTIDKVFCTAMGFLLQFSFLATFFWLNVMSFDIWWTFSGLRGIHRGTVREIEMKRFIVYCCYAWGGPVIMLVVSLVMDLAPNIPDHLWKPEFGKNRCFFSTKEATLAYFYGPVGVIILTNMVFFILTAVKIIQAKKATKSVLRSTESRSSRVTEANKQRFILYLKLFLIMGVNWGMEVVSWLVEKPQWIWYISDISNTLQGLLIFWIFVLSSKMRSAIWEKIARHSSKLGFTRTTRLPSQQP